jgi:hypothetical protein
VKPSVGRTVHYRSYGTPGGEFVPQCRAAIVTDVPDSAQPRLVSLAVLNPTGVYFDQLIPYDDGGGTENETGVPSGGSWHWPERTPE